MTEIKTLSHFLRTDPLSPELSLLTFTHTLTPRHVSGVSLHRILTEVSIQTCF